MNVTWYLDGITFTAVTIYQFQCVCMSVYSHQKNGCLVRNKWVISFGNWEILHDITPTSTVWIIQDLMRIWLFRWNDCIVWILPLGGSPEMSFFENFNWSQKHISRSWKHWNDVLLWSRIFRLKWAETIVRDTRLENEKKKEIQATLDEYDKALNDNIKHEVTFIILETQFPIKLTLHYHW